MKKKLLIIGIATVISMSSVFSASATWIQEGNSWKYQESDTAYTTNKWLQVGDLWYHFDQNGIMQTGWLPIKKKWYYLDPANGHMRTGWIKDADEKWYYMDEKDGYMWKNRRTPDGYFVDSSGVYDVTKGNSKKSVYSGPGAQLKSEKKVVLLKGVEFPPLSSFATENLTTDAWGTIGSIDSVNALNVMLPSPIETENGSLVYRANGEEKLRLSKAGDKYEIADYGSIDSDMETVLMAMCYMISSTPQEIYDGIYTAAEYDQRVMRDDTYTNFGDSKILYKVYTDHVVFRITAR